MIKLRPKLRFYTPLLVITIWRVLERHSAERQYHGEISHPKSSGSLPALAVGVNRTGNCCARC
jgi:hypothetical protein